MAGYRYGEGGHGHAGHEKSWRSHQRQGRRRRRSAHALIPGSEIHEMWTEDVDIDIFPLEEWDKREDEMAAMFADFLDRAGIRQSA